MDPSRGAELIDRLQRMLGIAILVQSVEAGDAAEGAAAAPAAADSATDPLGEAVTIWATFLLGSHATDISVTGDSESKAWEELGKAAIAWRNSDFQNIQMWPGGG
jgi:hypothetical protein